MWRKTILETSKSLSLSTVFKTAKAESTKTFSIELMPTSKTPDYDQIKKINPTFVSVIWQHNKEDTTDVENTPAILASKQLIDRGYPVLLHLAGRYFKQKEALEVLNVVKSVGIRNIFALRGEYIEQFEKLGETFDFAKCEDLIKFIKQNFDNYFTICVAGYPDCHPRSKNWEEDIEFLGKKISLGANFVITQAVFDSITYKTYVERCRQFGVLVPILPGIWMFDSYKTLKSCCNLCKVKVGEDLLNTVQNMGDDHNLVRDYNVQLIVKLAKELFKVGAPGIHLFSMNKLALVDEISGKIYE